MIDTPPVWLAACCALGWWLASRGPGPLLGAWAPYAGIAMMAAGIALMLAAVLEMRRRQTTVVPHRDPSALVTTGVFHLSRNPIYLGDVTFLAGFLFWLGAAVPLLLIPVFAFILRVRFILPEEARLTAAFGPAFERWCETTRRWI